MEGGALPGPLKRSRLGDCNVHTIAADSRLGVNCPEAGRERGLVVTIQRCVPRDRDRYCEHDSMGQITMDFQSVPLKRCKPAHVGRIPQDAGHPIRPPPSPSTLEPLGWGPVNGWGGPRPRTRLEYEPSGSKRAPGELQFAPVKRAFRALSGPAPACSHGVERQTPPSLAKGLQSRGPPFHELAG